MVGMGLERVGWGKRWMFVWIVVTSSNFVHREKLLALWIFRYSAGSPSDFRSGTRCHKQLVKFFSDGSQCSHITQSEGSSIITEHPRNGINGPSGIPRAIRSLYCISGNIGDFETVL